MCGFLIALAVRWMAFRLDLESAVKRKTMSILRIIKVVVAFALALCIFLPMSQCSGPVAEGHSGSAPTQHNYIFGGETEFQSVVAVASWSLPLVLALVGLTCGTSIKLLFAQLLVMPVACLTWFGAVVWSHTVLWPAYVAGLLIVVFFVAVLVELFLQIQKWRLTKQSSRTA